MTDPPNVAGAAGKPRDEDGTFLPGHQVNRTHGASAFEKHGESALTEDQRQELAAFRDAIVSDQGELTAMREGYVRRIVQVEGILQLLGSDLHARGLLTAKGHVRQTVQAFLQAVDRWDRLAQRLGLDRRTKRVPSLEELMAEPHDE